MAGMIAMNMAQTARGLSLVPVGEIIQPRPGIVV